MRDERRKLAQASQKLVEAPLYIDDTAGVNLMDMHAKLRRLQTGDQKLGLVIVDYLQLMSGRGRFENRNQEVSALSRGMKLLAKELNVPMLVLSQLSRAPETRQGDHRPQLSDLRESGSIEQDADLVGFIFREEVYKRDREDLRGLAELIIAKQRNGPIGKVDLVYLHALTKFENRAEDLGRCRSSFARLGPGVAQVARDLCARHLVSRFVPVSGIESTAREAVQRHMVACRVFAHRRRQHDVMDSMLLSKRGDVLVRDLQRRYPKLPCQFSPFGEIGMRLAGHVQCHDPELPPLMRAFVVHSQQQRFGDVPCFA